MRNIFVTGKALASAAGPMAVAGLLFGLLSAPAAAQAHCGGEYVVKQGDTLAAIAERCDSTLAGLVRANPRVADPDLILVGWRLSIPEAPRHDALGHDAPGPEHGQPGQGDTGSGDTGSGEAGSARAEAPAPRPEEEPGLLRLEGRLAEGPECPLLRTPDGEVYSLVGDMRLTPGAYVEISGRAVAISFCMRGTTVEVRSLRQVPDPPAQ